MYKSAGYNQSSGAHFSVRKRPMTKASTRTDKKREGGHGSASDINNERKHAISSSFHAPDQIIFALTAIMQCEGNYSS